MKVVADNFQSFEHIEFDFSDLGLAGIFGETGAGKSTFIDAPVWGIFGVTSKDTGADDVRPWGCEAPTKVVTTLPLSDGVIVITRVRGNAKQNDLFWHEYDSLGRGDSTPKRGKNMPDTQSQLEKRLGITADMFLNASYMSQFMDGGRFFTAKSKERRDVLDKIADLTVPKRLAERASEARKETKKLAEDKRQALANCEGVVAQLSRSLENMRRDDAAWAGEQEAHIKELQKSVDNFETDRTAQVHKIVSQLEELDKIIKDDKTFDQRDATIRTQLKTITTVKENERKVRAEKSRLQVLIGTAKAQREKLCSFKGDTCPQCLGPTKNANLFAEVGRLEAEEQKHAGALAPVEAELKGLLDALKCEEKLRTDHDRVGRERRENDSLVAKFRELQAKAIALRDIPNRYEDQLVAAKEEGNPYTNQVQLYEGDLRKAEQTVFTCKEIIRELEHRVASLTWLYDKSFALRGMMLEKAVRGLNKRMNDLLQRYFDASLRVKMALVGSDDLEVEIHNSGYPCKFAQLSGGERAQLKLTFGISYREAAENRIGRKFEVVMFDEALNGMDNALKVKAFGAFQEVAKEHGTVLLIDHSEELKSRFDVLYHVQKTGSSSEVVKIEAESIE